MSLKKALNFLFEFKQSSPSQQMLSYLVPIQRLSGFPQSLLPPAYKNFTHHCRLLTTNIECPNYYRRSTSIPNSSRCTKCFLLTITSKKMHLSSLPPVCSPLNTLCIFAAHNNLILQHTYYTNLQESYLMIYENRKAQMVVYNAMSKGKFHKRKSIKCFLRPMCK